MDAVQRVAKGEKANLDSVRRIMAYFNEFLELHNFSPFPLPSLPPPLPSPYPPLPFPSLPLEVGPLFCG